MTEPGHDSDRTTELEIKVAHLEAVVDELSDMLDHQRRSVLMLQDQCRALGQRVESLQERLEDDDGAAPYPEGDGPDPAGDAT